jgi:hypothetical protein
MGLQAKNPTLINTGSHWMQTGYPRGGELAKEEVYGYFVAEWRGDEVEFTMQADRYRYSNDTSQGWTDWRITYYHGPESLTGTACAALSDAAKPLMARWLASSEYRPSRQLAIRALIVRQIRDANINATDARDALMRHGHELNPEDEQNLTEAIYHLTAMFKLIDGRKEDG